MLSYLTKTSLLGSICLQARAEQQSNIKMLNLDDESILDNLKSQGYTLHKDSPVKFSVRGNPTTGYTWNVDKEATKDAFSVST